MKEYFVIEYLNNGLQVEIMMVTEDKLWDILERAHVDSKVKIAIFEVGKCVLDWS